MDTKIFDGKEYTKVAITELSINGESKDNSFSSNDLDNQGQIAFDIKIDSISNINPNSFAPNSLKARNIELNNDMKINNEPIATAFMNASNYFAYPSENVDDSMEDKSTLINDESTLSSNDKSTSINNKKINSKYYWILAPALAGLLYFIFH